MSTPSTAANDSSLKRNMPTLLILIVSGALIYALPYFRYYYYDAFVKLFNINNTQMGALGSAFGGTAIIGYMCGGFFADRWPPVTCSPFPWWRQDFSAICCSPIRHIL